MNRLQELLDGFRESLQFSNPVELTIKRLFARNEPLTHYCWQNRWHLYCDTRVADHYSLKELLSRGVYDRYIRASSRDGRCSYVNIGAHIGAFDIAVAASGTDVPFALSVELNPYSAVKLALHTAVNRLDTVRCINAGIGGKTGTFNFSRTTNSLTDGLYSSVANGGEAAIQIPVLTLDESLEKAGLQNRSFDLLKVDCESAEYEIVEQTKPETLSRFANIVMEIHPPPANKDPERMFRKLQDCGFRIECPEGAGVLDPALRFWTRK